MDDDEKLCPKCHRWLRVLVNVTFNIKTDSPDGFQPWCRECDHKNKPRRANGWPKFRIELVRRKLGELRDWDECTYHQLMESFNWECTYCGWDVGVWSGGYWIDKIDPDRRYVPDNCVPCCWPCNCEKSDSNPLVYRSGYLKTLLEDWGWGRIPWQQIKPRYRRIDESFPDLSEFVVDDTPKIPDGPEDQITIYDRIRKVRINEHPQERRTAERFRPFPSRSR